MDKPPDIQSEADEVTIVVPISALENGTPQVTPSVGGGYVRFDSFQPLSGPAIGRSQTFPCTKHNYEGEEEVRVSLIQHAPEPDAA